MAPRSVETAGVGCEAGEVAEEQHRHWERYADEWITWVRTPDHDSFWFYRDQFRVFVPPPGRATVEIGCGEGRIARELTDLGHTVTAVDRSPTLLEAARRAGSAAGYVLADATRLPFGDAGVDQVIAYNMLMDVDDMPAVVAEGGRILRPGGVLTLSIVHPFTERGRFTSREPDTPFVMEGSYFGRRAFEAIESRDGLSMHFAGWSHPLEDYVAAVRDAGLTIVDLREPRPDPADERRAIRWRRMPLFLWMSARR